MTRPLKTAAGIVLTAIMLFPLYWMINVSLTRDTDMRHDPPYLIPVHGTLEGYRAVMKNEAICIPGVQYKFITTVARVLPLGLAYRLGRLRSRILAKRGA